jgi:hypothetical protein
MRRKVFDVLASAGGAVVALLLVVAGSLLMWGYSFASSNVHNQLARQEIFFPPKAAFQHAKVGTEITPSMIPYLEKYAGQQVITGAQAEAYADHFIAVHLFEMPYHGVYANISGALMAHPGNAKLTALQQTSFQGTTLRGLLLEAYGFSQFAVIAFRSGIAAFSLAFLMAILVGLGFWHARRVAESAELLEHRREQTRELRTA